MNTQSDTFTYRVGEENPYIDIAEEYAAVWTSTGLAKAQAYATLAVAYELRELRKV